MVLEIFLEPPFDGYRACRLLGLLPISNPREAMIHPRKPHSIDPMISLLHRAPGHAMGDLLAALRIAIAIAIPGIVEGASIDVLRVLRKAAPQRVREAGVGHVWHGGRLIGGCSFRLNGRHYLPHPQENPYRPGRLSPRRTARQRRPLVPWRLSRTSSCAARRLL